MKTATTVLVTEDCGCEYYSESFYDIFDNKEWEDRLYIGYCDKHLPTPEEE